MKKQRGTQLLEKLRNETISEQERLELERWYLHQSKISPPITDLEAVLKNRKSLDSAFPFEKAKAIINYRSWPGIAAAILVLIAVGTGIFLYKQFYDFPKNIQSTAQYKIIPGGNKATLVLGNGKVLSLSNAKTGVVIKNASLLYNDGSLVAAPVALSVGEANQTESAETLKAITPRGGTYQIILPDKTHVWLNAESRLEFPSSFLNHKQRIVKLSGEAYFQVAKDKNHPFIVESEGQKVEVLGTHFNINSYADEGRTRTTLIEGSVKINGAILNPGEQSVLKNNTLKIQQINIDEAIAWKNGQFIFNDENIESIMRQISRWYDVDIDYAVKPSASKVFWGTISRFERVDQVLEILEMTKTVKFKIEGRRIIVMK